MSYRQWRAIPWLIGAAAVFFGSRQLWAVYYVSKLATLFMGHGHYYHY